MHQLIAGVGVHLKKDALEEIRVADEVGKLTHNVLELEDIGPLKWGTGLCVDDVAGDEWDVVEWNAWKFKEALQGPI